MPRPQTLVTLTLDKIVGGGQALGTLEDGRKCFVWGGLPGETVEARVTKKKSKMLEAVVERVITPSPQRIAPVDQSSYLSTSPWQIMNFDAEQHYKAALIEEAFELHDIVLPKAIEVFTDDVTARYRNKVEFSWYGSRLEQSQESRAMSQEDDTLDLAFFRRGSKGKIIVDGTSLAREEINILARQIRDLLQAKNISARQLKTLLIRCDQKGNCVWQLYIKDDIPDIISNDEASAFSAQGGEVIYSDPRSPASRITKRLADFGDIVLTDDILNVPFRYATEGFFQVNIPIYEQALNDMQDYIELNNAPTQHTSTETTAEASSCNLFSEVLNTSPDTSPETCDPEKTVAARGRSRKLDDRSGKKQVRILDLYSGVGTIGLTIGGEDVTLVESNEDAVREMRQNIKRLDKKAHVVLAPSENALDYITSDIIVIVDPPRAGLHKDVITRLLERAPPRIIYLSCNPVTQARDIALLAAKYGIAHHRGYNFFPRTPHIEHLVVLDRRAFNV